MGQPIRWDNVGGANLSEASRPLESAQRSFMGTFDTVGNALQQRQTIEDQNWQNTKNNNTNAFLDAVSRYKTPEEVAAATAQGGALDQLRQQFGNQVDANAIRGAADTRTAALQQQALTDINYKNALADQGSHPFLDAYHAAAQKGDQAGMETAAKAYQAAGGRDLGGLYDYATKTSRAGQEFNLNQAKGNQDIAASKAQIRNADAQTRIAAGNLAVNQGQLGEMKTQNQFQRDMETQNRNAAILAGRADAAKQALKSVGNLYADGVYNGNQSDELLQTMTKNGIGSNTEQRTEVIRKLNQIQKDGVEISTPDGKHTFKVKDLPMSAVTAAVNASYNPLINFGWNSGVGKKMEDNLKVILSQQYTNPDGSLSSKPVEDLAAFNQTIANARQNAPGIVPNRVPRGGIPTGVSRGK